jgi:hypothetical protein
MDTRCGDIDPGMLLYMTETLGLSPPELDELLNKRSGIAGMCGLRCRRSRRPDLTTLEKHHANLKNAGVPAYARSPRPASRSSLAPLPAIQRSLPQKEPAPGPRSRAPGSAAP